MLTRLFVAVLGVGAEMASVAAEAVLDAVRLELSQLELEFDFGLFLELVGAGGVSTDVAVARGGEIVLSSADEFLALDRLDFRQPPPTGTLRRTPPLVQYRRQLLQKWRG